MCRLGQQRQFVERFDRYITNYIQAQSQSQLAYKVQHFLGGDQSCRFHYGLCPADAVFQSGTTILQQRRPCAAFVINDARNDLLPEFFDDLLFAFSERGLVGDLEQVADCLGPLTVKPAHGKVHVARRPKNLLYLTGHLQCRKVQHDADAQGRSDIRRTGRQVSESA